MPVETSGALFTQSQARLANSYDTGDSIVQEVIFGLAVRRELLMFLLRRFQVGVLGEWFP